MLASPSRRLWLSRLLPYWLTVLATCWTLAYFYLWNSDRAYERYEAKVHKIFVAIDDESVLEWAGSLLGFMTPLLLAASLSTLLLTNDPLPTWRLSWVNKFFAHFRRFRIDDAEYGVAIHKKNQFGVGQPDFNLMSFWLVFLPGLFLFATYVDQSLHHANHAVDEEHSYRQRAVEYVSYLAGWVGTLLLSFFLIPVTRHSVLLVAMNWSPVHALRIHVWAGYWAFFFIFLHGIMIVGVWFKWAPGPIYEEIFPPKECWTGTYSEDSRCGWKFYNFTGMVAFIFMTVLWASSFNWFRRKWYRLFYILHVIFGALSILASIWHYEFIGLYLIPSILYYLASTMPTLVQALASRFRGGVKILEVIELQDAGDCLEVRVSMDPSAQNALSSIHPSQFIKLCVPKISVVWHPFTVYNHPNDVTTMRLLFRPIGPFTKALRSRLLDASERPVTLIDGFYRGHDHCQQALMCHDHVTIVAGGVAITPFLSMIFAIFKELQGYSTMLTGTEESKKAQPILRSMTLVWSCREAGLLSFIKNSYLNDMAIMASRIPEFAFKINIHYTGGKSLNTSTTVMQDPSAEISHSSNEEEVTTEDNLDEKPATVDAKVVDDDIANPTKEGALPTSKPSSSRGHTMELARMMPARFSSIKWNIPYFFAFSASVWLAFHIMFSQYDYSEVSSYRDNSELVWVTILVIVFFFLVGAVVEGGVLLFRNRWPAPRYDDFQVLRAADDEKPMEPTMTGDHLSSSVLESYSGRPSSNDMLADAQRSTAPGIFVCGPKEMTFVLRQAAGQENSAIRGLTRYAIYEESFEM